MFRGNTSTGASRLDTSRAARALHHAVAKLRAGTVSKKEEKKKKVPFFRWVPFVHFGR